MEGMMAAIMPSDGNRTMAMLGNALLKSVLLDDLIPTGASRG
jgi:hypothetical protein